MQIAKAFDSITLKNIGISLGKTVVAVLITWLGSNIDVIASAVKDPKYAVLVVLILRSVFTVADEWRKGQDIQKMV